MNTCVCNNGDQPAIIWTVKIKTNLPPMLSNSGFYSSHWTSFTARNQIWQQKLHPVNIILAIILCQTKVSLSRALQKHAYSNIQKISPPKTENFSYKNFDIYHIFAQNIDCGYTLELPRRGSSNEYPQSMFLSRNKKIMYTPVNPSFTI